jgi:hypothetical protein
MISILKLPLSHGIHLTHAPLSGPPVESWVPMDDIGLRQEQWAGQRWQQFTLQAKSRRRLAAGAAARKSPIQFLIWVSQPDRGSFTRNGWSAGSRAPSHGARLVLVRVAQGGRPLRVVPGGRLAARRIYAVLCDNINYEMPIHAY